MPSIDSYSLDNYGLDGPASLDSLLSKTGGLTTDNGQKKISGIGFKPLLLIVTASFDSGYYFGYSNIRAFFSKGGTTSPNGIAYGYDSRGNYFSGNLSVNNVVFSDNEVSFDVTLSNGSGVSTNLSYHVFGV